MAFDSVLSGLPLLLSVASFTLSIISLVVTYRQKKWQDKISARKALTDTIAAIAQTNIEFTKLTGSLTDKDINMRRNFNSQRRYLSAHAEVLMAEIPKMVTDVDHNLVAGAMESAGDYARADYHWRACVAKSPTPTIRAQNLRGFARFLFNQGNSEAGRQHFELSLQEPIGDNDTSRRMRSDTYGSWAVAERQSGFNDEANRRHGQATSEAGRIGNEEAKKYALTVVEQMWNPSLTDTSMLNSTNSKKKPPAA